MPPLFHACDHISARRGKHGPGWGWRLARAMSGLGASRLLKRYSRIVLRAYEFVDRRRRDPGRVARLVELYPDIAAAEAFQADQVLSDRLKLLILAGCSPDEVAARLDLDAAHVAAWEQLFFDVRPLRLSSLWISRKVIMPEQRPGRYEFAARLKTAYELGPEAACAILDLDTTGGDPGVPLADGTRAYDRRLEWRLKFDAAIAMPLGTPRQMIAFVKVWTALTIGMTRLDLARDKLVEKCRESARRHELACLRTRERWERERRRAEEAALKERGWTERRTPATAAGGPGRAASRPDLRIYDGTNGTATIDAAAAHGRIRHDWASFDWTFTNDPVDASAYERSAAEGPLAQASTLEAYA